MSRIPDEQAESSRRLEEYRIRTAKTPEHHELDDYEELDIIDRINKIYMRTPKPKKKFNYYVFGSGDGSWPNE